MARPNDWEYLHRDTRMDTCKLNVNCIRMGQPSNVRERWKAPKELGIIGGTGLY